MNTSSSRPIAGLVAALAVCSAAAFAQKPDLAVTSLTFPSEWKAGAFAAFEARIANVGSIVVPSTQLGIYKSTNSTITAADTLLKTLGIPSLRPKVVFVAKTSLRASSLQKTHHAYIGARADNLNALNEANERNNTKSKFVKFTGRSDLVIRSLTVPPMKAGGAYTIRGTVDNRGGVASGSFRLALLASRDQTITVDDDYVRVRLMTSIPAGQSRAFSFTGSTTKWPTSWDGARYVAVLADIGDVVEEVREDNNTRSVFRNIAPFDGSGAHLDYTQTRYAATNTPRTPWAVTFDDKGGRAKIGITAPRLPRHHYVLIWSLDSQKVEIDAMTELGLQLLGTPMMSGWLGQTDGSGKSKAILNLLRGNQARVQAYTYSVWFDAQFANFVGLGSNRLAMAF